ncbi:MAG TPA: right-handed parallel beta-helix repeat-containing protein [Vicinamibacteria bacterium]|nr:right-handed parallel beta-helix repeat-containing protein [Vicinamibacteria bacterium]
MSSYEDSPVVARLARGHPSLLVGTPMMSLLLSWVSSAGAAVLNVPGDFTTIQAAHNAAASGDTILVAPGTYVERITMTKAITLASHFLTSGNENFIGATVLDGGNGPYVISIPAGAEDGPTIQGLTIQNATDGIAPFARFNLLNCVVRNTSDGVDYERGSGGLVRFSTFELNSDDGIDLDFDVDIQILDNVIRDNGDDGIEIRLQNYTGPTKSYVIAGNDIYRNVADGIQLISYDVETDRFFQITNNFIHDNGAAGLGMMDGAASNEDFRAASLPEVVYVFNNTFAYNNHGLSGGDNTVVLNNIFVGHPAIAVKSVDANSALAFNLFFDNGTSHVGSNVDVGTSVFEDPLFGPGLELLPNSPAIDAGTAIYVWQGTNVLELPPSAFSGEAPDIGAFEFESGDGLPPDPPILAIPADGALNVGVTPTLAWRGKGAIFTVHIARDPGFAQRIVSASTSVRKYDVKVGALDHVTTYYWRVSASNGNGTSDFSDIRSFTTQASNAPPAAPALVSPANGAREVRLDTRLFWAGTADDFDIQVSRDPNFFSIAFFANTASTQMQLPRGTLAYDTIYHWRARGKNALGSSNFSAPFTFTTGGPPDTVPPSQPRNLRSPAQTPTTIDLAWDAATDNVGVKFYIIYRDGSRIATESGTTHTAVGLTPGTTYDFRVSALDAGGNESLPSPALTVATQGVPNPVGRLRSGRQK